MTTEELSRWLGGVDAEITATKPDYPLNVVPGSPIPFFGNILTARVLTVGVNPSSTEFTPERLWLKPRSIVEWQRRLLNYFNWPEVPAHNWFETWSTCLELLHESYAAASAAHLDISPRPTMAMIKNSKINPTEFRAMVEHDVKWFFDLLNKLPQIQLLLVAGPIPRSDGSKQQLADFIFETAGAYGAAWIADRPLPRITMPAHPDGIPIFVCPFERGVDGLYAMVRQVSRNRELLRQLSAPRMSFVPILPEQLTWSSAIGNFIINFGLLDYLIFEFLESRLPPDQFAAMKREYLHDRIARIKEQTRQSDYPPDQRERFEGFFHRFDPIRELRNHIAHSHLLIRQDDKTREFVMTLSLPKNLDAAYSPESRHLSFAELQKALDDLKQLIEEFRQLTS